MLELPKYRIFKRLLLTRLSRLSLLMRSGLLMIKIIQVSFLFLKCAPLLLLTLLRSARLTDYQKSS